MQVTIEISKEKKAMHSETKLGFGTHFTDHMFSMDYKPGSGWHNPRIVPYGPLSIDPATMMLHYAQGVFEGLKAYRLSDGDEIQMFRPRENFRRMNRSCNRLCIPQFDEEFVLNALKALIRIDKSWVPSAQGTALYIRPTIIATDPFLGVRASDTYRFFIILSPVGAYYAEGFNPIKIWVADEYVRAVRGGVGEAKTGGNYAASIYAGAVAKKQGFSQVLWLDGVRRQYIEEVGAMNIFFVLEDKLITPELNGSILPGITRDSVLQLARRRGYETEERKIAIDDIVDWAETGLLKEAFGTGTAAVISPVGEIKFKDKIIRINDGDVGAWTREFYALLTDIQYGRANGPEGWIEPV